MASSLLTIRKTAFLITSFLSIMLIAVQALATTVSSDEKTLIRKGSKECRASKNLRRSNLKAAKEHLNSYEKILIQAKSLNQNILKSSDSEIQWILKFCNTVADDIAHAEALDIFEMGLKECATAKTAIDNSDFSQAQQKAALYKLYKKKALNISNSILNIYENSYEMRLCEKIDGDIALLEKGYQEKQQLEQIVLYKAVISQLNSADSECGRAQKLAQNKADVNNKTIPKINKLIEKTKRIEKRALVELNRLKENGIQTDDNNTQKIKKILGRISRCRRKIPDGIANIKAILSADKQPKPPLSQDISLKLVDQDERQILEKPAAYPPEAARKGIQGYVEVSFTVTKTGKVQNIEIISAKPPNWFEESVIEAVKNYKFQPKVVDGKTVDVTGVRKKIVFVLKNRKLGLPKF